MGMDIYKTRGHNVTRCINLFLSVAMNLSNFSNNTVADSNIAFKSFRTCSINNLTIPDD